MKNNDTYYIVSYNYAVKCYIWKTFALFWMFCIAGMLCSNGFLYMACCYIRFVLRMLVCTAHDIYARIIGLTCYTCLLAFYVFVDVKIYIARNTRKGTFKICHIYIYFARVFFLHYTIHLYCNSRTLCKLCLYGGMSYVSGVYMPHPITSLFVQGLYVLKMNKIWRQ